ncbi:MULTISPECIES: response regulator [unclassified Sinorhizobium]|uniref:response regulator n=1 Tax=unclassified Sinorhizobium TaxID=2613772 RepID=UPI00352612F7
MSDESTLLIIDDNADDRETYRRTLKRVQNTRYTVLEAETGEEGIALTREKRPDCILLDYSLPGQDGIGILAEIRELDPDAIVIMLTGQGNETVAVEVMKNGARDYLTKDVISPESLHRCIQSAIMHGSLERKLEQKRQSLEIFTRAMAHDLKEPLRTIKSFGRILYGSAALPREDRELLDYMLSAADHMEELIVKVSGFTRLEASNELEMKPVFLDTVLTQVKANLLQQIESRGARIDQGALPEIRGDATMLAQLLQNLVSNAIHYCRDRQPEIHVRAEAHAGFWHLIVSDNGPGVAPEHHEVIFQPFKRLVGRGIEGTGLGLAICRRIAQLHGGSIWCESRAGQGATFVVAIPDAGARSAGKADVQTVLRPETAGVFSQEPGRLADVLLVDDCPADVQLLKIKLMKREKVNFNLHVAANGEDALQLVQRRISETGHPGIDLMLLDINMPIMDGFELLDALASDSKMSTIPVCMLSTSGDVADVQRAKARGARAYMVKPATLQQLQSTIRDIGRLELIPMGDGLGLCVERPARLEAVAV